MGIRFSIATVMTSLLFFTAALAQEKPQEKLQDTIGQLLQRVEMLEKQQEEILVSVYEERPRVRTFFNDKLTLGGFYEPSYSLIEGKDTHFQVGSHSHLFGLNFAADYSTKIRFVGQLITGLSIPLSNEHNDPRDPNGSKREFRQYTFSSTVSQAYASFMLGPNLTLQAGLGYVPLGYYAQLREPTLFLRRGGPQTLRTENLFAPLWMGLNLVGETEEKKAGYNIYTAPSVGQSHKPGMGARAWNKNVDYRYTLGISAQTGRNNSDNYQVLGLDFTLDLSSFKVLSEGIIQLVDGENPWAAFVEPTLFIYREEVLAFAFAGYSNGAQNVTRVNGAAIADPYQKWEMGGGLNWLPITYTRLRTGITFHDYVGDTEEISGQNRDYAVLDFSAGVSF